MTEREYDKREGMIERVCDREGEREIEWTKRNERKKAGKLSSKNERKMSV